MSLMTKLLDRFCSWWDRWGDLLIGLMWIYMALVCLGKGELYGMFVSFFGMLWWALLTRDIQELEYDLRRALSGWTATINAMREDSNH